MTEAESHLTVTDAGGVCVVGLKDRKILDELAISSIGDDLTALVQGADGIKMLVCFENVEHLSSAALGMLIKLQSQVDEKRGKLKLSDISPQIFEVFKITRLNKLFDIHGTRQEALESF